MHLAARTRAKNSPPALVVPIVVCHGRTAWPGQIPPHPDLEPLDPESAAALAGLQARVDFLVDDLNRCTEAELRAPDMTALAQLTRLCLAFLPHLDAAAALAALDRWGDLLHAVDRDEGPPMGRDAVPRRVRQLRRPRARWRCTALARSWLLQPLLPRRQLQRPRCGRAVREPLPRGSFDPRLHPRGTLAEQYGFPTDSRRRGGARRGAPDPWRDVTPSHPHGYRTRPSSRSPAAITSSTVMSRMQRWWPSGHTLRWHGEHGRSFRISTVCSMQ